MLCLQTLAEELHTISRWEYDQEDGYSFDFLIRKLPPYTAIVYNHERDDWQGWIRTTLPTKPKVTKLYFRHGSGDTPADAAAVLAIRGWGLGMVNNLSYRR